jgi:nucleoside phosphorylase
VREAPGAHEGPIVSVDLFYENGRPQRPPGAIAVEMEAATLFALGGSAGVPVGCVLAVSDVFTPSGARQRIDDHHLQESVLRMGAAAMRAIAG